MHACTRACAPLPMLKAPIVLLSDVVCTTLADADADVDPVAVTVVRCETHARVAALFSTH